MATYHWNYSDLLGNYDFWMPLDGTDAAQTSASMTLTKQSGTDLAFVSDTIKSNTQVLNLDTAASSYEYYTYTGTPNAIVTNPKYDQGWGLEFWVKISANPTSTKTILKSGTTNASTVGIDTNGKIIVTWTSSSGIGSAQTSNTALSLNTWHLITISSISRANFPSATRNLIYIDGICDSDNAILAPQNIAQRTELWRFEDGTYSSAIKIANLAIWMYNAPMPRQIVNRYKYLTNKTNYNDIVNTDSPKLWVNSNTTTTTDGANSWSLPINAGSGTSLRVDGRWEGALKQNSPYIGQWDHAVTFGTPTTDVSNWFYSGNWSIEFWHKNEMGSGSNFGAANQHFALYATNPLCIVRNTANAYRPGCTVRYGNTAITVAPSTTASDSIAASQYATGEWNHYVLTSEWDSGSGNGTLKLYYNGRLDTTTTFTRASLTNTGADANMTNMGIGFISTASAIRDNSYDDLILYDTVLTHTKVKDRYYAQLMHERDVRYYRDAFWNLAQDTRRFNGTVWVDWDRNGSTTYWNGTSWVNL